MASAVNRTLVQQLQSLQIEDTDFFSKKTLTDLVETVCEFIQENDIFGKSQKAETAEGAIFVYLIYEEGKKFRPRVNWYTIDQYVSPYPGINGVRGIPQPELRKQIKEHIYEFLWSDQLNNLNFKTEMDKIRPLANQFIRAALAVPNRAVLDAQSGRSAALGRVVMADMAPKPCCIIS
jgi:hypothetical protein